MQTKAIEMIEFHSFEVKIDNNRYSTEIKSL